jgi:hypothetical protein
MAGPDIQATQQNIDRTLAAVTSTATRLGVNINDPAVKAFITHTANIQAQQHAEALAAWNIVNSITLTTGI